MITRRRFALAVAASPLLPALARAQDAPEDRDPASEPAAGPIAIPDENRADRTDPPPRPPIGDAADRARTLFEAILRNEPARAADFFFPQAPFRVLKGIADPDRYWGVLFRHYERDIAALHEEVPAGAEFDRFEMTRRGGWVERRQEANALPYWASRHDWVYYRVNGRERRFEVRTLINWGPRWFITHLS